MPDKKIYQYKAKSTTGAGTKAVKKTREGLPANKDGYPTKVAGLSKALERGRNNAQDTVMAKDSKGVARAYTTGVTKTASIPPKMEKQYPKLAKSEMGFLGSGSPNPLITPKVEVKKKEPIPTTKRMVKTITKYPKSVDPNALTTKVGAFISPSKYNASKTVKTVTKVVRYPKKK